LCPKEVQERQDGNNLGLRGRPVAGRKVIPGKMLSDEGVELVLFELLKNHDAETGVNWDTIAYSIRCQQGSDYPTLRDSVGGCTIPHKQQ